MVVLPSGVARISAKPFQYFYHHVCADVPVKHPWHQRQSQLLVLDVHSLFHPLYDEAAQPLLIRFSMYPCVHQKHPYFLSLIEEHRILGFF